MTTSKKNKQINQTGDVLREAVVTAVADRRALALLDGESVPCVLPGALTGRNALAVGDRVRLTPAGGGQYRIGEILPRESALYRGDRRKPGEEILVAANVQVLLTVVGADYLLHQAGYPESALLAARRAGAEAVLYLSKWDLVGERAQALLPERLEPYRERFSMVLMGSALDPQEALAGALRGRSCAVVGDRGSGKTALVRSVLATLRGEVPGRSVLPSTHVSALHPGEDGTALIDTPGFRDFALAQVTEEEGSAAFPELSRLSSECAFRDCTHVREEGCRVLEALRAGEVRRERYDAWKRLGAPAPSAAPKPDYRREACAERFVCKACGALVTPEGAGTRHRNHCPGCLSSLHVDDAPGDRASLCGGVMEPIGVWVRKGGEWALIHRCKSCGALSSNRIASDDNPALLLSIAVRPLGAPPFPLDKLGHAGA